jgi:hypothetical protein
MAFTDAEIRELSSANGTRGWAALPDECPPQFRAAILEKRARQVGLRAAAPAVHVAPAELQAEADALRARLNTLSIL